MRLLSPMDEKTCLRCGRRIEWRKKWESCWEEIRYCSQLCKSRRLSPQDKKVEAEMMRLLEERGKQKSICPSDPVRLLFPEELWRDHMETARMAARRLVAQGKAEILQKGQVMDPSTARGPIRVRLKR